MSSSSPTLLVRNEGRVRRLTLNRPSKRNALDGLLCREFIHAVQEAGLSRSVGAILLDGEGSDFCAGMDLDDASRADAGTLADLHQELFCVGAQLRKPMIAAVRGAALAGGLGLALNAHIVLASSGARFGVTEVRVGLWPYMIFPVVAAAVGERCATALALTGRIFDANEALQLGLVDEVMDASRLSDRAAEVSTQLANGSCEAVELGLTFIQQARGHDPDRVRSLAREYRLKAHASRDFQEGVAAFLAKRKPVWPSTSS